MKADTTCLSQPIRVLCITRQLRGIAAGDLQILHGIASGVSGRFDSQTVGLTRTIPRVTSGVRLLPLELGP